MEKAETVSCAGTGVMGEAGGADAGAGEEMHGNGAGRPGGVAWESGEHGKTGAVSAQ